MVTPSPRWWCLIALCGCDTASLELAVRAPPGVVVADDASLDVSIHAAGVAETCDDVAFGAPPPPVLLAVHLSDAGEQPFVGLPRSGRKLVIARLVAADGEPVAGGCRAIDAADEAAVEVALEPAVVLSGPPPAARDAFGQVTASGPIALGVSSPAAPARARVRWQLVDWRGVRHEGLAAGEGDVALSLPAALSPGPFHLEYRGAWSSAGGAAVGLAAPRVERVPLAGPITASTPMAWGRVGPHGEPGLAYTVRGGGAGVDLALSWFERGALRTARADLGGAQGVALATRAIGDGREEVMVVHREAARPMLTFVAVRAEAAGPVRTERSAPLGLAEPSAQARWVPTALLDVGRCEAPDEAWAVQLEASDHSGAGAHLFLDATLRESVSPFRAVGRAEGAVLVAAGCADTASGGPRARVLVAGVGANTAQFEVGVRDPASGRVNVGRWSAANSRLRFSPPSAAGLAPVTAALQSGVELSAFRYLVDLSGGDAPFVELARYAVPVGSGPPVPDEDGSEDLAYTSRGVGDVAALRFIGARGDVALSGDVAVEGAALGMTDVDDDGVADVVLLGLRGEDLAVVHLGGGS